MQTAQFALHAEIEDRHWWFVARRQILRSMVRAVLPPGEDRLVIDVGCGTGANAAALADDYRVVGVDTSEDAVRLASQRFPRVEFRHGFAPGAIADVLPVAGLVLLSDVLEHVPDDFALLSSLLAAAQPGTHFLLTVPADLSLWSPHDEAFGHYRRYDAERLRQIWAGLPVGELCLSHFNSRLYPLVKAVRWWNRRHGKASGEAGTDMRLPNRGVNRVLERVLASEQDRLLDLLPRGIDLGVPSSGGEAFTRGVSLLALLKRLPGPCQRRTKPADLAADYFDPVAALAGTV